MSIQDKKVMVFDEYGGCIKEITLADLEYTGLSYTLHYISDPEGYKFVIVDSPQQQSAELKKAYEWASI
jgi:hypothetical protein